MKLALEARPLSSSPLPAAATSVPAIAAELRVPRDHSTLQGAVSAAGPGDTIIVARGTYAGPVTSSSNQSGLMVDGDNDRIHHCRSVGDHDNFYVTGDAVQVKDCEVRAGSGMGIVIASSRGEALVRGCTVIGTLETALIAEGRPCVDQGNLLPADPLWSA